FIALQTSTFRAPFLSYGFCAHCDLRSFPTRRSSDLFVPYQRVLPLWQTSLHVHVARLRPESFPANQKRTPGMILGVALPHEHVKDRKSTRLNSSHVKISYAVFCLKIKIKQTFRGRGA